MRRMSWTRDEEGMTYWLPEEHGRESWYRSAGRCGSCVRVLSVGNPTHRPRCHSVFPLTGKPGPDWRILSISKQQSYHRSI